jgi:NAD(P)H-dependent FMN reductase
MATTNPKKIALIIGSTRSVRAGPAVVDVVHKIFLSSTSTPKPELSIIDIAEFNLPVFNERVLPAMVPAQAQLEHEHSKAWSAAIALFDGYVLVSPEYNYGVPGGVKNAIDYLYNEWIGKPMLIVTYGIHGGKISSDSLQKTLEGMKLRVVETRPQLTYAGPGMDETFATTATGTLGPKTMKLWEEEGKEPLLKGFKELVELLESPAPEPAKQD